jgi:hypothetical protein
MAVKKNDSTAALVAVVSSLEPLNDQDRQWVLQSAASKFALTVPVVGGQASAASVSTVVTTPSGASGATADAQSAIARKDPRAFIRIKKPATDVQRVACIGYYLVQTTGQQGFTSKAISTAYTDSGGSKINMTRALDNATRGSKYLSTRGPGEKQLTTVGEDVVHALPDQAAVRAVEAASRGGRGGKKGRQTKASKKA